jgi:Ca2+-transporting ATPase
MTTVHSITEEALAPPINLGGIDTPYLALTKGAVDGMLAIATRIWVDQQIVELDEAWLKRIQNADDKMAQQGMRVLGLALRPLPEVPTELESDLEQDIVFVGMVGMIDPPRREVKQAVQIAKRAGMRPPKRT